jgi:hypothetical protein
MELGHDFFGLMKTARHFIGFALLAQPSVDTFRAEPNDFDFNEFASLVSLTSAPHQTGCATSSSSRHWDGRPTTRTSSGGRLTCSGLPGLTMKLLVYKPNTSAFGKRARRDTLPRTG